MKRGVDRGFVIAVVVVVAAAVFLSNVRPSVSGMGGTFIEGRSASITSDTVGYYRGPSDINYDRIYVGHKSCRNEYGVGLTAHVQANARVINGCNDDPFGTLYYTIV